MLVALPIFSFAMPDMLVAISGMKRNAIAPPWITCGQKMSQYPALRFRCERLNMVQPPTSSPTSEEFARIVAIGELPGDRHHDQRSDAARRESQPRLATPDSRATSAGRSAAASGCAYSTKPASSSGRCRREVRSLRTRRSTIGCFGVNSRITMATRPKTHSAAHRRI